MPSLPVMPSVTPSPIADGGRFARLRQEWWQHPRTELLAGLVVALALIPEAVAFSIIAGGDPQVGLYASFSIAIIIAFAGGQLVGGH